MNIFRDYIKVLEDSGIGNTTNTYIKFKNFFERVENPRFNQYSHEVYIESESIIITVLNGDKEIGELIFDNDDPSRIFIGKHMTSAIYTDISDPDCFQLLRELGFRFKMLVL